MLCWQQSTWIAWHSHIKLKWLDSWFQGSHDASVWEGRGQVGAGKRVDVAVFWKGTEDASCAKCHPFLAVRRWSVANEKRSELSASPSLSRWICPTHMWHFAVLDRYQVQRLFGTALILAYFAESWRNRTHVIGLCWQSLSLQEVLADRLKSSVFIIVFLATFKIFLHTLWKNIWVAPSASIEFLFGMLASRKAEKTHRQTTTDDDEDEMVDPCPCQVHHCITLFRCRSPSRTQWARVVCGERNDDFAVAETTSDFPVQCKTRAKSDGLTC